MNELALTFLRYNTAMLKDLRSRIQDLVGQASLIEGCVAQRREIMARK